MNMHDKWKIECTTKSTTLSFSVSHLQMKNNSGQISIASIDDESNRNVDIEFATLCSMQEDVFHFTGMMRTEILDLDDVVDHLDAYVPVAVMLSPLRDEIVEDEVTSSDPEALIVSMPTDAKEKKDVNSSKARSFDKDFVELMDTFDQKIKGKEFTYDKIHDGSEGNFIESLFEKEVDNLSVPDWKSIEFKSRRSSTNSMVTLFSKSPVNGNLLRSKYGKNEVDDNGEVYKRLNATIGSSGYTRTKSNPYNFMTELDDVNNRLVIKIADAVTGIPIVDSDEFYWDYSEIEKSMSKINNLALFTYSTGNNVNGDSTITVDNVDMFHFDFPMFKKLISTGGIKVEIRMGMYRTGKKKGQMHDHGTAFRVSYSELKKILDKQKK